MATANKDLNMVLPPRDPLAKRIYQGDFSDWISGTLTAIEWLVTDWPDALVISGESFTAAGIMTFALTGGVNGTDYTPRVKATDSAGNTCIRTVTFPVRDR